jgi:site-specific DNA-cytosine methylase
MTFVPVSATALTAREGKGPDSDATTTLVAFSHQAGGDRTASGAFMEDCSPTLQASQTMAVAFSENQRGEVLETAHANQLSTGGGKPGQGYPAVRQGMAVRRLTPTECERLMGLPDGWTEGFSDSTRYRMLGNSVAVPVAEWIGRRIVAADALRQAA